MPERCAALPPAIFSILQDVDLLLHAGDVGELWVLDQLSSVAPVIAVHGNDETADAQRALPLRCVLSVAGQRIVLHHSHQTDPEAEAAARRDNRWDPKLDWRAALGLSAGAMVVVFGHTHIPMALRHQGIWLVNPGAMASANAITRQQVQTVALLFLCRTLDPLIVHVEVAAPDRAFVPQVDWSAGFQRALEAVSASILSPPLAAQWEKIAPHVRGLTVDQRRSLLLPVVQPCWNGERDVVTPADLLAALQEPSDIPDTTRRAMVTVLQGLSP
jgi:putative phosphoesterase